MLFLSQTINYPVIGESDGRMGCQHYVEHGWNLSAIETLRTPDWLIIEQRTRSVKLNNQISIHLTYIKLQTGKYQRNQFFPIDIKSLSTWKSPSKWTVRTKGKSRHYSREPMIRCPVGSWPRFLIEENTSSSTTVRCLHGVEDCRCELSGWITIIGESGGGMKWVSIFFNEGSTDDQPSRLMAVSSEGLL